jgi:hypothetical protein
LVGEDDEVRHTTNNVESKEDVRVVRSRRIQCRVIPRDVTELPSRTSGSKFENAEALSADDFSVVGAVGREPRDKVAATETCFFFFGNRFDNVARRNDFTESKVSMNFEFGSNSKSS